MVGICAVPGCPSTNRTVRLHGFPKDKPRLQIWLENIGRSDIMFLLDNPKKLNSYRICNKHFDDDNRIPAKYSSRSGLLVDCIPTLFMPGLGHLVQDPSYMYIDGKLINKHTRQASKLYSNTLVRCQERLQYLTMKQGIDYIEPKGEDKEINLAVDENGISYEPPEENEEDSKERYKRVTNLGMPLLPTFSGGKELPKYYFTVKDPPVNTAPSKAKPKLKNFPPSKLLPLHKNIFYRKINNILTEKKKEEEPQKVPKYINAVVVEDASTIPDPVNPVLRGLRDELEALQTQCEIALIQKNSSTAKITSVEHMIKSLRIRLADTKKEKLNLNEQLIKMVELEEEYDRERNKVEEYKQKMKSLLG